MKEARTPEEAVGMLLETIAMLQVSVQQLTKRVAMTEGMLMKQADIINEQHAALLFLQHTLAEGLTEDHTIH